MATFGKRIRALSNAIGKEEQQIAEDLGITKSRLSHYINGRNKVPSELLQEIVDKYGINPSYLFRDDAPLFNKMHFIGHEYNFFPAHVSAGLPNEVDGITQTEKISISDKIMGKYAGNKDIYITKINGDSMNKVIPDNSLIAVRPVSLEQLKNNDIVVYSKNGEYAVKRYFNFGNEVEFRPDSYDKSFRVDTIQLDNDIDLKIKGKVVLYIVELD